MDQKLTKWRLDGDAWVISKIEECSDLDERLETMPMRGGYFNAHVRACKHSLGYAISFQIFNLLNFLSLK